MVSMCLHLHFDRPVPMTIFVSHGPCGIHLEFKYDYYREEIFASTTMEGYICDRLEIIW